jgi:ATP-dependent DNA ligase
VAAKIPAFAKAFEGMPVPCPIEPMLAKRADKLPANPPAGGEGWIYEPKWDGFRCIAYRDGDAWLLQSRDKKTLNRYFPELEAPLLAQLPERCVLDGELIIPSDEGLDFGALQMRIHPAESRVLMLSEKIPASLVFWDLLALGGESLLDVPFENRRARLEAELKDVVPPLYVTPITRDRAVAADWFDRFEGAGLDGVMAKAPDGSYQPKKRSMLKVKHKRTTDCVVAGFRWHKNGPGTLVGSLLLGLYDEEGKLHHVGVAASFTEKRRAELVEELAPYRKDIGDHPWKAWAEHQREQAQEVHRRPGATSRWNRGKDLTFEPLRIGLVVEVSYDHMQSTRFRHTAHFVRWRPDKPPADCTYAQLEVTAAYELGKIFARGGVEASD